MPNRPTILSYPTPETDLGVLRRDGSHLVVYWSDGHVDPVHRDARGHYWHAEHGVRLPVHSRRKGDAERIMEANAAAYAAWCEAEERGVVNG